MQSFGNKLTSGYPRHSKSMRRIEFLLKHLTFSEGEDLYYTTLQIDGAKSIPTYFVSQFHIIYFRFISYLDFVSFEVDSGPYVRSDSFFPQINEEL